MITRPSFDAPTQPHREAQPPQRSGAHSIQRGQSPQDDPQARRRPHSGPTYNGADPDGYALAVNIARRHLTKGQIAMVAARARLVSKQSVRQAAEQFDIKANRIAYASVILDHAPDLADLVVSGAVSLDAAYKGPPPDCFMKRDQADIPSPH